MSLKLILLTIVTTFIRAGHTADCVTPNNERAACTSIYSCPILLNSADQEFVRRSYCNGTSIVCCGSHASFTTRECITPNNEKAVCKSLHSCPILSNPQADREFLRQSKCTGTSSDSMVCCGTRSDFTAKECITPNNEKAVCKSLSSCQTLSSRQADRKFVRQSKCGETSTEVMVCCGSHTNFTAHECVTPNNEKGVCKSLNSCPVLSNSQANREFVRQSKCGGTSDSMVCCGSHSNFTSKECITPNNETAVCTHLYSCPILSNAQADREFLRQSKCGGTTADPMVCCGSHSNFTSKECLTPNNERAVCTSLHSCSILSNSHADREFVRQSKCGGTSTEAMVCCGSHSNFTSNECVTPNNEKAVCTSLYSCPILSNSQADREFLRQSKCGTGTSTDSKVCCGSYSNFTSKECITPNNERAECTHVYSCSILSNSQANREFVRQSKCGGTSGDSMVCCGSHSNFITNECVTPNHETAVCKSLRSCSILSRSQANREYVRQSRCGGTSVDPMVCCGSHSDFNTNECVTPNNETAVCKSLRSCSILSNSHADKEFIRQSNCGGTSNNPMVCCGSHSNFTKRECVTPNNHTAVCKSLYSCRSLYSEQADREFIRQSNCGGTAAEPMVCCGSHSNFTKDECTTPNNETATCTSLYLCRTLYNSQADREFVRLSNCGGTAVEPMVCCGSYSDFVTNEMLEDRFAVHSDDLLPNKKVCGMQYTDTVNNTVISSFPWLALIRYSNTGVNAPVHYGKFLCVGSLINRKYVLTSAHCLTFHKRKPVGVHFGNYRFANDCGEGYQSSCNRYVQDFDIERIIPHPDFDRKVYLVHDIGLVRLNGMVTYSEYIRPVCLPSPGTKRPKIGDVLVTSGWDEYINSLTFRKSQKKTLNTIIKNEECSVKYDNLLIVTEGQMCGHLTNYTETTCSADIGGPAVYSNKARWYQAGIIPYYSLLCELDLPIVYIEVAHYIDWIRENLEP